MDSELQTKLITTDDGSHSLFVPHLNEHYHSTHGAIQESRHVFINMGLNACKLQQVNVLEIGFGTGLNAFSTQLESKETGKQIHYTSLELYPLDIKSAKQLNYAQQLTDEDEASHFLALHEAPWGETVEITPTFTLHKIEADFSKPDNININTRFDVIYFDAFAPEKQPEMWTQQIFNKLFSLCNKNGTLTTYCAKGIVRRMFESAGFIVERLPGPPGKREILRCRKM
ncbi:MAG: tRNA (5-methylaminomethyl-2-thiouridine)(34)-methyltransferase MnmD [Bacteroidales bacterium]|nr:tRNA (5-methylaminomethyl-2-thiouridine)(34)-methyltransferase MnmD [Bacteroidales bacterium]